MVTGQVRGLIVHADLGPFSPHTHSVAIVTERGMSIADVFQGEAEQYDRIRGSLFQCGPSMMWNVTSREAVGVDVREFLKRGKAPASVPKWKVCGDAPLPRLKWQSSQPGSAPDRHAQLNRGFAQRLQKHRHPKHGSGTRDGLH